MMSSFAGPFRVVVSVSSQTCAAYLEDMNRGLRHIVLMAVVALAFGPTSVRAQVRVRVMADDTKAPLAGALVYLMAGPQRHGAVLTDSSGVASLSFGPSGTYQVRAEYIGRASDSLSVWLEGDSEMDAGVLHLKRRPLVLDGLTVWVDERCEEGGYAPGLGATLWGEARKALAATVLTRQEGRHHFESVVFERDVDRGGLTQRLSENRVRTSASTPFVARTTEDLPATGFIERRGGADFYYAPDAALLLSDSFIRTHCFGIRRGEHQSGSEIGLTFVPLKRAAGWVDISGTLWLDSSSLELRRVEFRYDGLEGARRDDQVGGRVDFRRMETGGWIVSDWIIRMPTISWQQDPRFGRREYVSGYRHSGGRVVDAGLVRSELEDLGRIDGIVRFHAGAPAQGSRVALEGTGRSVRTDDKGRFSFQGVSPGFYRLRASDSGSLIFRPEPAQAMARVLEGGETVVDLVLDDPVEQFRLRCSAQLPDRPDDVRLRAWPPGQGLLVGTVVDTAGRPVGGVEVRVGWSDLGITSRPSVPRAGVSSPVAVLAIGDGVVFETVTSADGTFRFCGLKQRDRLRVSVVADGRVLATEETSLDDPRVPGHLQIPVLHEDVAKGDEGAPAGAPKLRLLVNGVDEEARTPRLRVGDRVTATLDLGSATDSAALVTHYDVRLVAPIARTRIETDVLVDTRVPLAPPVDVVPGTELAVQWSFVVPPHMANRVGAYRFVIIVEEIEVEAQVRFTVAG